ncbi:MAG: hypothetical protein CVV22_12115 [Ignavibacteriae bacterium HGW-Ignavibacteriae-1]|nr:MAG: hypothetical protein CVV22_12115 [Ignavibacteriae bacterium HGW-Ignavibacteriae-1]
MIFTEVSDSGIKDFKKVESNVRTAFSSSTDESNFNVEYSDAIFSGLVNWVPNVRYIISSNEPPITINSNSTKIIIHFNLKRRFFTL